MSGGGPMDRTGVGDSLGVGDRGEPLNDHDTGAGGEGFPTATGGGADATGGGADATGGSVGAPGDVGGDGDLTGGDDLAYGGDEANMAQDDPVAFLPQDTDTRRDA
jgi:hypothetical protein